MRNAHLGRFSGPLFLFGATVLAASAFPVQAQVNQAQVKTFNIPAQSAQSGIPQFAQQADLQILVPEKLALGQNTSTVQGTMPVQDGLRRLLTGTSLTPVTQSNGAVILVKASLQTPASADATAAIAASATADTVPGATPPVAGADATTEVVVKGTRAALMKAREIKRKAPNIIESIVAEDIGK